MDIKLKDLFRELKIDYQLFEHPPVYTVDDAIKYWSGIEATHCKNLFLRNKKGDKHFLVVAEHSKQISIKQLEQALNEKLSFASPDRLKRYLNLEPGSVSPFGLIYDTDKSVSLIVDEDLKKTKQIGFHPNINTATITLSFADFQKFIQTCKNQVTYLKL